MSVVVVHEAAVASSVFGWSVGTLQLFGSSSRLCGFPLALSLEEAEAVVVVGAEEEAVVVVGAEAVVVVVLVEHALR